VVGLLRFEGQIVTVLSLASLLGNAGWRDDPQTLLVLDLGGGRLAAVDCEQVPRATALPRQSVDEARQHRPSGGRILAEILGPDRRTIHLIDVPSLLERRREPRDGD
jgi:chemotaxis signal transduction protein